LSRRSNRQRKRCTASSHRRDRFVVSSRREISISILRTRFGFQPCFAREGGNERGLTSESTSHTNPDGMTRLEFDVTGLSSVSFQISSNSTLPFSSLFSLSFAFPFPLSSFSSSSPSPSSPLHNLPAISGINNSPNNPSTPLSTLIQPFSSNVL